MKPALTGDSFFAANTHVMTRREKEVFVPTPTWPDGTYHTYN